MNLAEYGHNHIQGRLYNAFATHSLGRVSGNGTGDH